MRAILIAVLSLIAVFPASARPAQQTVDQLMQRLNTVNTRVASKTTGSDDKRVNLAKELSEVKAIRDGFKAHVGAGKPRAQASYEAMGYAQGLVEFIELYQKRQVRLPELHGFATSTGGDIRDVMSRR